VLAQPEDHGGPYVRPSLLGNAAMGVVVSGHRLYRWGLGFRQFRFHHAARALQDETLHTFGHLLLS